MEGSRSKEREEGEGYGGSKEVRRVMGRLRKKGTSVRERGKGRME